MKRYIAFFDLDKTIIDSISGKLFISYGHKTGYLSHSDFLLSKFMVFLYGRGILTTEYVIKKWAKKYKGVPQKKVIDFSEIFFNDCIKNHIREKAIEEIALHKKNNGKTVVLSAALFYICNPLCEYLEMDDVICTNLEVKDGVFTGKLLGSYCYREEKLNRVEAYCNDNGFTLDSAFYYADSIADVPVLERVGNPICITPDKRLRNLSMKRGWKVYDW